MTSIRIPVQPLLDFIERRGGLNSFPGMGIETEVEIDKAPYTRIVMDRTPEEYARFERTRIRLKNYRDRDGGTIPLDAADEIACDVLHVHPFEIWGGDWYELSVTTASQVQEAEVEAALADLAAEVEAEEIERLARVAA